MSKPRLIQAHMSFTTELFLLSLRPPRLLACLFSSCHILSNRKNNPRRQPNQQRHLIAGSFSKTTLLPGRITFVEALAAEDRSILILAGFWLEHEILTTALHALVDSYDVYVLLDATPPRSRLAFEPARERLNQAGAVPVIASQVVNEWSIEAEDALTRSALVLLLPPLINAG